MKKTKRTITFFALLFLVQISGIFAQDIEMDMFHGIKPRNIGPAGMSGRVTALEVDLNDMDNIYLGSAAGGIWKSENSGHTWETIFENEMAASIGAIALYQKNPNIIYVGTGEGNPRNSQNSGWGMDLKLKVIDIRKSPYVYSIGGVNLHYSYETSKKIQKLKFFKT